MTSSRRGKVTSEVIEEQKITETVPGQAPVIRSAGITLVGSALGGVLVILNELLAARLLQSQAYGLYASGITVARIGEAVSVFGIPMGIFHFIPVYRQRAQRELVAGTIYAAALLPLLIGTAFAIATWLAAPWLATHAFSDVNAVSYIRLLAVAIPFMASTEVLGALTRGFGYSKYYVIVKNLTPPVVILAALAAMAALHARPLWITAGIVLASVLGCAAGVLAVVRVARADLWQVRPIFPLRELYGYSAGIMLNTVFYMVFALTGILVVGVFLGSESVGIYRVCLQAVVPFDMVLLAFHAAMGPVYPVLARENKVAALEDAYETAIRWMAIVLLPVGVVLVWNRNDLLGLAGPEFVTGANALVILAIGYSVCTCFGTVAYLLMLSGHKSVETWNAAFAAILNLALAIALVPRFGLAGAAFATAFSFVLLNILRVAEARYLVGLRTFRPYFLRIVAVSAAGGVSVFVMLQALGVLQGSDAISVAFRIALMAVMHAGILWTIGLSRRDRDMLWALVPSFTGRTGRGR